MKKLKLLAASAFVGTFLSLAMVNMSYAGDALANTADSAVIQPLFIFLPFPGILPWIGAAIVAFA